MVKTLLLIVVMASAAFAQLPDAPTRRCQSVAFDADGRLAFKDVECPAAVDAAWKALITPVPARPATFLTFRKRWTDPPLRTNRQTFKSPLFLLSQAGMVISMVVACRNPRSGEHYSQEVPAVGVVLAMDYMNERLIGETLAVGPPIYAMAWYGRAARK